MAARGWYVVVVPVEAFLRSKRKLGGDEGQVKYLERRLADSGATELIRRWSERCHLPLAGNNPGERTRGRRPGGIPRMQKAELAESTVSSAGIMKPRRKRPLSDGSDAGGMSTEEGSVAALVGKPEANLRLSPPVTAERQRAALTSKTGLEHKAPPCSNKPRPTPRLKTPPAKESAESKPN